MGRWERLVQAEVTDVNSDIEQIPSRLMSSGAAASRERFIGWRVIYSKGSSVRRTCHLEAEEAALLPSTDGCSDYLGQYLPPVGHQRIRVAEQGGQELTAIRLMFSAMVIMMMMIMMVMTVVMVMRVSFEVPIAARTEKDDPNINGHWMDWCERSEKRFKLAGGSQSLRCSSSPGPNCGEKANGNQRRYPQGLKQIHLGQK
uniref:Uncharacterized protein n=1 Tax=Anopheles atroparvus TaxID=41427 RepID=A0A182IQ65_ANOAO